MATAVLQADYRSKGLLVWQGSEDIKEAVAQIGPLMSFSRHAPPPQLPQIPADVWIKVWDELVDELAEDAVAGAKLLKLMPLHLCICCCGPCIVMPKMFAFNRDQAERWCAMLSQVQPLLEPYGVGVSIVEELSINSSGAGGDRHIRSQKVKVGLRFDGASGAGIGGPQMPAPSQVAMPMANQTVAEKLRDLKQLKDDGILSEWEFEQKKAQVLSLM